MKREKYGIMCIVVILCLGSILIINNNKASNKNNYNDIEIKTLKGAKYTPEEMLFFFKGGRYSRGYGSIL